MSYQPWKPLSKSEDYQRRKLWEQAQAGEKLSADLRERLWRYEQRHKNWAKGGLARTAPPKDWEKGQQITDDLQQHGGGSVLRTKPKPAAKPGAKPGGGAGGGGGGGGGGAPAAAAPVLSDGEIEQQILDRYPTFAWLLDEPDVRPLLLQLGRNEIDSTTFQGRLYGTGWWKSKSESVRQWDTLNATDPATAGAAREEQMAKLRDLWGQMGAGGIKGNWNFLTTVENSLRFGWSDEQIRDAVAKQVKFGGSKATMGAQNALQAVRRVADDYGVPVTRGRQVAWARELLAGQQDEDTLRGEMSRRAMDLYEDNAALVRQLKAGRTVREYAEPYVAVAAEELEIDPNTVNLRDPKWNTILVHADEKGNRRGPTLAEWQRRIREVPTYGWDNTGKAREMAAADALNIQKLFGAS